MNRSYSMKVYLYTNKQTNKQTNKHTKTLNVAMLHLTISSNAEQNMRKTYNVRSNMLRILRQGVGV